MLSTLLVTLWAAGAAQGTVVLLPVEIAEFGGQTASRRLEVEEALRGVLGSRLKKAQNGTLACDKPNCFRVVAETHAADEVAVVALRRRESGGFADLTVRVFDADGEPVFAITETLPQENLEGSLRQTCTRAFDPSAHAGTVLVRGAEPNETVLLDGLPIGTGTPRVSVGEHRVTARNAEGRERTVDVVVPYGAVGVAELPAPAHVAAARDRALWPAVFALSTAVGGVVLAGGAVGIALFDLNAAADSRRIADEGRPLPSADPAAEGWVKGYGVRDPDHPDVPTPTARARWTAVTSNFATANEVAAYALFGTAAAGLIVAVGGGFGGWILWPENVE